MEALSETILQIEKRRESQVCDHWIFQEVGVIDLANGRASEEGGLGPKTLNQCEDWLDQPCRREGPSKY